TLHVVRPGRQETRLVSVGGDAIEAREHHVIQPMREAQRVDDGGARDDEDGGIRQGPGERLRHEQRAVDVPESEGVVRVEEDLGADRPARLHLHFDGGDRRRASHDLYAFFDHRGTHAATGSIPGGYPVLPSALRQSLNTGYVRVCEYQSTWGLRKYPSGIASAVF